MSTTLLVPVDLTPHCRPALDYALRLGAALGDPHVILAHAQDVPAEIEALAVQRGERLLESISEKSTAQLEQLAQEVQSLGFSCEFVIETGRPDLVVPELAERRGCNFIVMTTHGRTGLRHAALGSVAERVIRHAPCPVVTLRNQEDTDPTTEA
jgi:universal stress protein A